jgi:serine protease Do
MWIKNTFLTGCLLVVASWFAYGDAISSKVIQKSFSEINEAVCVVTFTQEATDPRTGEQKRQDGNAVGLLVSSDGLVISNGHLQLENISSFNFQVYVRRNGEDQKYPAVLLEKPGDINISLLRIQSDEPLNLPFVRFKRNSALAIGDSVALIGIMGESMDFQRCVELDLISAVFEEPRHTYCLTEGLRLGFVTSPVVNAGGEVVGIVGFDLGANDGGGVFDRPGSPLVFQTDLFIQHIDNPPDVSATVVRTEEAWLGVFTQPLTAEFAEYWGIEEPGGLIVSTVVPDSPAAGADIIPGDIIRAINGTPLRATQDRDVFAFTKMIRDSEPNAVVELQVLRNGEAQNISVTLGLRPRSARDAEEFTDETFGLVVREITRDVRILLNISEDVTGVIVRRVISGSPAHLAKIRPGVIIMGFGDHAVTNLDDYEQAVEKEKERKPDEISVFARVGTATGFFRLQPRWEN